jgi:hypothetical protein
MRVTLKSGRPAVDGPNADRRPTFVAGQSSSLLLLTRHHMLAISVVL